MPITICFICEFNVAKKRIPKADERPSYSDCDRCRQPTCRGHGTAVNRELFYCIRCVAQGAS